jgi:hypothetical protein
MELEIEKIGHIKMDIDLASLSNYADKKVTTGRKVIHQLPKNKFDRATIVSIFPKIILEVKHTIFPGRFEIPAADKDDFSILVIESSSYYKPSTIEKMPPTEIQVNAAALAESIVNDYLTAVWMSSKGSRSPGLFWIPGEWTKKTILGYTAEDGTTFAQLLENSRASQKVWFKLLVDAADELWARSGGNPKAIPEDSKMGAEVLGIEKSKPWMQNTIASTLSNCPSCGSMVNLNFPVCHVCKAIINKEKAKELDLVFSER